MKRKAYLQSFNDDWFDDFIFIAKPWLERRGFKIVRFDDSKNPIESFVVTTDDIVIGSVEATQSAFNVIGVEIPKYIGYPESMNSFYGRKIEVTTVGNVRNCECPIFIKPKNDVKLFTGEVISNDGYRDLFLSNLSDDLEIYTSPVIDIISEYRCSVNHGKLLGIKHYIGDFTVFPDVSVINDMIECYDGDEKSYALDVGITAEGETILVEINDYWAIGSYGLDGRTYTKCLIDRWYQITCNF